MYESVTQPTDVIFVVFSFFLLFVCLFFLIITDYGNVELIMNCNTEFRYPMQRGCIIHGVIDQDISFHTLLNN